MPRKAATSKKKSSKVVALKESVEDVVMNDPPIDDSHLETTEEVERVVAEEASDPGPSTLPAELADAAQDFVETMTAPDGGESVEKKLSMEERKSKLNQLRSRMQTSARENRADLISESTKAKASIREAARLDRQRKLAETLRLKADAEERGDDAERVKNWEYTIEENDAWEKKLAQKARRADFEFHDDAHSARRRYKKDLDVLKPDLVAYNRQKEIALGLAPGTLVRPAGPSGVNEFNPQGGGAMEVVPTSEQQRLAAESFYRDGNTLLYADNKPSEEAIDRVVGKLNMDLHRKGKFSRKRLNDDNGDITYINERNRVFNKKIARYYDKYTEEIRASFERGTAL